MRKRHEVKLENPNNRNIEMSQSEKIEIEKLYEFIQCGICLDFFRLTFRIYPGSERSSPWFRSITPDRWDFYAVF